MQLLDGKQWIVLMARLGLVCVVLWAVFVQHALSVDAKTYTTDWICVGDLKKPRPGTYWGSTIVQRSMEKIFVWYEEATRLDRPGPVSKALFVFPVAYETAQPRLRRLAAGRFGEVKAVETKAASFLQDYLETLDDSDRVLKKFARKKQEKERKNLGLHGIKVDGFRQIKLSSADYNEGWTPGGSSELTLWILDGADVLGVVSTLAIVSRVDYGRIFGRFPHTRIPGFWSVKPKVVTVTEYALERFRFYLNLGGFPKFGISDSRWMLDKEASIHATTLFG